MRSRTTKFFALSEWNQRWQLRFAFFVFNQKGPGNSKNRPLCYRTRRIIKKYRPLCSNLYKKKQFSQLLSLTHLCNKKTSLINTTNQRTYVGFEPTSKKYQKWDLNVDAKERKTSQKWIWTHALKLESGALDHLTTPTLLMNWTILYFLTATQLPKMYFISLGN